ncbi:MAG: hypothetical protein RIQ46_754, partial [Pseudomonadota bacterium]
AKYKVPAENAIKNIITLSPTDR